MPTLERAKEIQEDQLFLTYHGKMSWTETEFMTPLELYKLVEDVVEIKKQEVLTAQGRKVLGT